MKQTSRLSQIYAQNASRLTPEQDYFFKSLIGVENYLNDTARKCKMAARFEVGFSKDKVTIAWDYGNGLMSQITGRAKVVNHPQAGMAMGIGFNDGGFVNLSEKADLNKAARELWTIVQQDFEAHGNLKPDTLKMSDAYEPNVLRARPQDRISPLPEKRGGFRFSNLFAGMRPA